MRCTSNFPSIHRLLRAGAAIAALLVTTAPGLAGAQLPTPAAGSPAAAPAPERLDPNSPRAAMLGFLKAGREGDWKKAATFLNLAPVPQDQRARQGPVLARDLKAVLDQKLWVEIDLLSNRPEGHQEDGLPARRDRVGTIQTDHGPVDILLERVRDGEGHYQWLVSGSTVARIPKLYDEFGYGVLGDVLPSFFFATTALEIQLWQWIGLLAIGVLAWMLSWLLARAVIHLLARAVARSQTEIDDAVVDAMGGPLRLAAALAVFALGAAALELSVPAKRLISALETAAGIIAVTWLVLRLIDVVSAAVERRLLERDQRSATSFVPLGRKTIKTFVAILAGLAALDSFGFDVTALIAGLGIGGLAVALALQKTLENLFGGATLIADRPVRVGDFCRFGDRVGTVEEIGMRSTRVRTLDRTLVTVPNAEFATMQLENFAARDRIWFHPRLGLRYETTPDQLRYVLVEIRRMLYSHPKVDADPARIRFVNFGAYSLDLDVFAYIRTSDYGEYLEITEDLNLRIMDIIEQAGTGFAFPSNTTYIARDDGLDEKSRSAAHASVEEWKHRQELYLPGFPADKVAELAGTLPWPPEGSPAARAGSGAKPG